MALLLLNQNNNDSSCIARGSFYAGTVSEIPDFKLNYDKYIRFLETCLLLGQKMTEKDWCILTWPDPQWNSPNDWNEPGTPWNYFYDKRVNENPKHIIGVMRKMHYSGIWMEFMKAFQQQQKQTQESEKMDWKFCLISLYLFACVDYNSQTLTSDTFLSNFSTKSKDEQIAIMERSLEKAVDEHYFLDDRHSSSPRKSKQQQQESQKSSLSPTKVSDPSVTD